MQQDEATQVGRYRVIALHTPLGGALLLDTITGTSWTLDRDMQTFQALWRPVQNGPSSMPALNTPSSGEG